MLPNIVRIELRNKVGRQGKKCLFAVGFRMPRGRWSSDTSWLGNAFFADPDMVRRARERRQRYVTLEGSTYKSMNAATTPASTAVEPAPTSAQVTLKG